MLHINHLCYFLVMPLFLCFRALVQLLWISFVKEPLWLLTCSGSSIAQAAHHQRIAGKPADRIFCCTCLIDGFLAGWFNSYLQKLKLFSKYRILKLAVCKLASFHCGFLPCSFHLVLEFPQHEFTASFNVCNTEKPLWEAGLKQLLFFFPYASSNTSSLHPTTQLPHFQFSCWCFL